MTFYFIGIPGPQGIVGPEGLYDPNLDEIKVGPEGPQGEIGEPGPRGYDGLPGPKGKNLTHPTHTRFQKKYPN